MLPKYRKLLSLGKKADISETKVADHVVYIFWIISKN